MQNCLQERMRAHCHSLLLFRPRYCHCRQVSYGEMIACENPEVRSHPAGMQATGTM